MTDRAFTTREIAQALGVTKNAVARRARQEGWAYFTRTCRGGTEHVYYMSSIPGDVTIRLTGKKLKALNKELADLDVLLDETVGKIHAIKMRLKGLK